jgi:hypothetical protein
MRITGCLLAVLMLLGAGMQSTLSEEPTADKPKPETKPVRQYAVKCHFVGEGMNNLTTPEVIVNEGEEKLIADTQSKSVLLGKKTNKANTQAKRDLAEGITLDVTVQESDADQAILDLAVEMSCIDGDVKKGQVRVNSEKFRVLDCVTLGKKTIAEFGHFNLEIMVSAVLETDSDTTSKTVAASASPIRTSPTTSD